MEKGYLYIISHKSYGDDTYKLGCDYDNGIHLRNKFNIHYLSSIVINYECEVCNKELAKKLLFHKLRKYRLDTGKEFFKCKFTYLKRTCIEIQNIINEEYDFPLKDSIDPNLFTNIKKYNDYLISEFIESNIIFTKNHDDCESLDSLFALIKIWYNESYGGRLPISQADLFKYLIKNCKCYKDNVYGVQFRNQ